MYMSAPSCKSGSHNSVSPLCLLSTMCRAVSPSWTVLKCAYIYVITKKNCEHVILFVEVNLSESIVLTSSCRFISSREKPIMCIIDLLSQVPFSRSTSTFPRKYSKLLYFSFSVDWKENKIWRESASQQCGHWRILKSMSKNKFLLDLALFILTQRDTSTHTEG